MRCLQRIRFCTPPFAGAEMAWLTALQVGGTVLSGLGAMRDRKQQPGLDLAKLRRDSKANGFNPLTVLRMTGGAGFTTTPSPSALSVLGGTVSGVADVFSLARDRKQAQAESDARIGMMNAQVGALQAPPLATQRTMGPISPMDNFVQLDESRFAGIPASEIPFWNVRDLSGQEYQIRADVLERVGIAEGSTIVTEDWEMMLGELGGEFEGITQVIKQGTGFGDVPFMRTTSQTEALRNPPAAPTVPMVDSLPVIPPITMRNPAPMPGWNDYLGFN